METQTATLTKSEALAQGYTLCGRKGESDYQHLSTIADLNEADFEDGELVLATKEFETPAIAEETIREYLAEMVESDWGNDTGDDTEQVFKVINKLDFSQTADMINKATENIKSYQLTDIVLTNDSAIKTK